MGLGKRFKSLQCFHNHSGAGVTVTVQFSCGFFYDRHEWQFYFDSHVATLNTAKDLKILNIAASTKTCC